MNRRLPVTLVGGFLGAGKTSLLHHFISEHRGGHLALLVESDGAVNHDAKALHGLCGAMQRTHDAVLEIPSGDEAAKVAWIAGQLEKWSQAGHYERVLIEVAGTTNPARLGRHFNADAAGRFSAWAELRQIVCVVDALESFRGGGSFAADALIDFQKEQVAGANLIVLNKCDLVDDEQRTQRTKILRALNPTALVIETDYGEIPPEGWMRSVPLPESKPAKESIPPDGGELALGSTLYRAYRPLHPARFWEWFNADHPGLWRMKGIVWLATRTLLVGSVSRTRWQNGCGGAGIWWAALPREDWPTDVETLLKMRETWREPYGDRRQELVLLGESKTLAAMTRGLDACLLTEAEYAGSLAAWSKFPDPFPAWDLDGAE